MSTARFSRFLLRTTDVAAAAAFYEAVIEGRGDGIVQLPEAALARGARPHWLGQIGVSEVGGAEAVAARFVERGAVRLGAAPGSDELVVLRDPGGAIVGLTGKDHESSAGVVWHQLSTRDAAQAADNYSSLFDWSFTTAFELAKFGRHQRFSFGPGESSVGVLSDIEERPEVHPHWLFYFAVPSLDLALERVRGLGGLALGPVELPNGVRIAVCDDPQGAAFGLVSKSDAAKLSSD